MAVGYLYCPWSKTEDLGFDGTIEGLDLPWSAERLNLIKHGKADPTENELRQWRHAKVAASHQALIRAGLLG